MKSPDRFNIYTTDTAADANFQKIRKDILEFNAQHFGGHPDFLAALLVDDNKHPHGGLAAFVYKDTIMIDVLWVADEHRGKGYGSALMNTAEAEAKRRGCQTVTVDTFSFQAEGFYKKLDYDVIATVPNYCTGFDRIFFRKTL